MANEYSTVDCWEVKETATEEYSIEGGTQASVTLECLASNKDSLVSDLISNQRPWPNNSFSVKPRAYAAGVVGLSGNAVLASGQQNYTWDRQRVTVKYSTDPNKTLFSESIEPTIEFIRLDHRFFRWSSGDPLTEGESPGVLMPGLALVRQFFQRPTVPSLVLTAVGKVNVAGYVSSTLGLTFPAQTLLFAPNPVTQTVTVAGSAGFDYGLKWIYKPQGWNVFYRPTTNAWEAIHLPNGTVWNNYPTQDFSSLLF